MALMLITLALATVMTVPGSVIAAPSSNSPKDTQPGVRAMKTPGLLEIKPQFESYKLGLMSLDSQTLLEIREDRGGDFRYWRSEMVLELSGNQITMNRKFHWKTDLYGVKSAVWQVSLFPFPPNMTNWDSPPGLLADGKVTEVPAPDMFAEFLVDFRLFAPKEFAIYKVDQDKTVKIMTPMDVDKLLETPKTQTIDKPAVVEKDVVKRDVVRKDIISAETARERTMVTPSDAQLPILNMAKYAELSQSMMRDTMPVRYYIRLVTLGSNGQPLGKPSLPVIVTGDRPAPLPDEVLDALAKDGNHPSARLISYVPLREQASDFNYHVIVTRDIPGFSGIPGWGSLGLSDPFNTGQNLLYYKGQKLDITPPPPKEKSAWDQFLDDCASTVDYFENIVNSVSNAYNMIKQTIINTLVPEELRGVFTVALDVGLVALGIPPSIPNFSELTSMGADYLIAQAASQVGISKELAQEVVNGVIYAAEAAENGGGNPANWLKPDPDYMYRPAIVTIEITNNTDTPTDLVTMRIETKGKDQDLFLPQTLSLPVLAPGETMRIPVCLTTYIQIDAEGSHVDVWKNEYYTIGQMKLVIWTEWQQGGYFPKLHSVVEETIATTETHYGKGVIPPMPLSGN
jgi:hypothetical protein